MELRQYETVFILTPILSEAQMKDTVDKFRKVLSDQSVEMVHEENWGLKSLAYPIDKKATGFYYLFEYKAGAKAVSVLETEFRRDERVLRFLTVVLDKHAVAYNEKKRARKSQESSIPKTEEAAS